MDNGDREWYGQVWQTPCSMFEQQELGVLNEKTVKHKVTEDFK